MIKLTDKFAAIRGHVIILHYFPKLSQALRLFAQEKNYKEIKLSLWLLGLIENNLETLADLIISLDSSHRLAIFLEILKVVGITLEMKVLEQDKLILMSKKNQVQTITESNIWS